MREATLKRKTKETDISMTLTLDKMGKGGLYSLRNDERFRHYALCDYWRKRTDCGYWDLHA